MINHYNLMKTQYAGILSMEENALNFFLFGKKVQRIAKYQPMNFIPLLVDTLVIHCGTVNV